ncbi:hypothetical protein [Rhodocaloribacter sp.]
MPRHLILNPRYTACFLEAEDAVLLYDEVAPVVLRDELVLRILRLLEIPRSVADVVEVLGAHAPPEALHDVLAFLLRDQIIELV